MEEKVKALNGAIEEVVKFLSTITNRHIKALRNTLRNKRQRNVQRNVSVCKLYGRVWQLKLSTYPPPPSSFQIFTITCNNVHRRCINSTTNSLNITTLGATQVKDNSHTPTKWGRSGCRKKDKRAGKPRVE